MKNLFCLLLCALVSSGISTPVHDEQLPTIGGPLIPVYPIILNFARECLLKVQENLRAAGRVEEAFQLNKIIKETERFIAKVPEGTDETNEHLRDHLDAIYNTLQRYKDFLPVPSKLFA